MAVAEYRELSDVAFADHVRTLRTSLIETAVSASDTIVVLDDWVCAGTARLQVAHISAAGWVDLFTYTAEQYGTEAEQRRHISLTPHQAKLLVGAYMNHLIDEPTP